MKKSTDGKILLGPSTFGELDASPLKRLKDAGWSIIENPYKRKLTKPELLNILADDVVGIIAGLESLDREVMQASNLKVISRCGSGMTNVDIQSANEFGIKICSTPYGPTEAVAELTLGALLNLLRMISLMDRELHRGSWKKKIGVQLEGKTVAIVGFGRIGKRFSELLKPFNLSLIVVDPFVQDYNEKYPILTLEEALPKADIISFHLSGEDTLLSTKEFKLIKPGAYLLNAARGGVIDEMELEEALKKGIIKGAWLDTFEQEPYTGPLKKYNQVLLSPHIGSYTLECRRSMEMESVENLIAAFGEIMN